MTTCRVVPTATRTQPRAVEEGQESIWPTLPPGAMFSWVTGALGVGDISSDGSPPKLLTGSFCLAPEAEIIRLPDHVKMEEPHNG